MEYEWSFIAYRRITECSFHYSSQITDDSLLKIQSSFPSLGALPTIDITPLLTSVQKVELSDADEGIDTSMPDPPKTVEEGKIDILDLFYGKLGEMALRGNLLDQRWYNALPVNALCLNGIFVHFPMLS